MRGGGVDSGRREGGTGGNSVISFTRIYMDALSQHKSLSFEAAAAKRAERSRAESLIVGDVCGEAALRSVEVCWCVWQHFTRSVCCVCMSVSGG